MSSTGQIIGAVAGALVMGIAGYMTGGLSFALMGSIMMGATVGAGIGGIIDPTDSNSPLGQPELGNLDVTTATEGLVITDFLGTTKKVGNIFWYDGARSKEVKEKVEGGKGGGGSKKVTVGYEYFLSWAVGLAIGPVDELYTVFRNDEPVWSGNLKLSEAVAGATTITLEDVGSMTFYFGNYSHPINSTIGAFVGTDQNPSMRGLCWVFFNDCSLGDYNRVPTFKFIIRKSPVLAFNSHNVIGSYDYNPAHAIWYILNTLCELSDTWLDEDAFSSFADGLYDADEKHGISVQFEHAEALSYINQILAHVGAVMPFTDEGAFAPRLLRSDVATGSMLELTDDESLSPANIMANSYLDTQNDIKVQYSQIYDYLIGAQLEPIELDPNDAFPELDGSPPDEDKWTVEYVDVVSNTGGSNEPVVISEKLFWHGEKPTAYGAQETFRTMSNWWLPAGQEAFEIEVTVDKDIAENIGQTSYGPTPIRFGVITKGTVEMASPNFDGSVIFLRPTSWLTISHYGGIGFSSLFTLTSAHWPLRLRVRRERQTGSTQIKTGCMFYNNVTNRWENSTGGVGVYWFGVAEADRTCQVVLEFSSVSGWRTTSSEFQGTFDNFQVNEGEVLWPWVAWEAGAADDTFSGVAGSSPDDFKWRTIYDVEKNTTANINVPTIENNKLSWSGEATAVGVGEESYKVTSRFYMPSGQEEWSVQVTMDFDSVATADSGTAGNYVDFMKFSVIDDAFYFDPVFDTAFSFRAVEYMATNGYWYIRHSNDVAPMATADMALDLPLKVIIYSQKHPSTAQRRLGWSFLYRGTWSYIDTLGAIQSGIRWDSYIDDVDTFFGMEFSTEINVTQNVTRIDVNNATFDSFQVLTGTVMGQPAITESSMTAIDIRQASVHAEDPANKEVIGRSQHKDIRMMLFTQDNNARWAAARAVQMASIPLRSLDLPVNRKAATLKAGDPFLFSSAKYGISEAVFRLLQYQEGNLEKEEIVISAVEDSNYLSSLVVVDEADREGSNRNPYLEALEDLVIVEAPYVLVGENYFIIPLVGRVTGNETGYIIYISSDGGSSYTALETMTTFATYGTLTNLLSGDPPTQLDNETEIEIDFVYDADASLISSISRGDMLTGLNVAVITDGTNQEIICFQTIVPHDTEENRYVISNLYRGRYDTYPRQWPAETSFYFIGFSPPVIPVTGFSKGMVRHFKAVPFNTLKLGDISEATAYSYTFTGRSYTPYIPGNFRANDMTDNSSASGATYSGDIDLTWSPRIRGEPAGIGNPDDLTDAEPTWEGFFEIETWMSSVLVDTETAIDDDEFTYASATLATLNGGTLPDEVTFKLTNYITTSGVRYSSEQIEIIVTKV